MSRLLKIPISRLVLLAYLITTSTILTAQSNPKLAFWDQQRKGANGDGGALSDSGTSPEEWFAAAAQAGIDYVRLSFANWKGHSEDFLMGDADDFKQLVPQDLAYLRQVLDVAQEHEVKIVLCAFQLPGAKWRQRNNMKRDFRIWTDEAYQEQAITYWEQIAAELKDHPAIVGYNILNEPHPSWKDHPGAAGPEGFEKWLKRVKGTTADLNLFYEKVVQRIRTFDPQTPIMLDAWQYASIEGFPYLQPIEDEAILYAFHFYGRWLYATFRVNKGKFRYPDKMPVGEEGKTESWAEGRITQEMTPVFDWAKQYRVPINRIVAAEFGVDRRVAGARQFLKDTIKGLNAKSLHWAFYSFRSSTWDGMDYELGTDKMGWKYWQARETGQKHEALITREDNPLWNIFKTEFSKQ
ncbi:MAG: glycoside hydrolase family 5 protein [Saprospiraceae bacterium]|nr:glycoside hydrolase family 5 protein [Saprospiraceae bacterium]